MMSSSSEWYSLYQWLVTQNLSADEVRQIVLDHLQAKGAVKA